MLAWAFFRALCILVLWMMVAGIALVAIALALVVGVVYLVVAAVSEVFRKPPPRSTVRP